MRMDKTVVYYMEWLKRMTDIRRIHLKALEQITTGLVGHLREIAREGDISRAQKARNSLAMYKHVLDECGKQGGYSLLRRLKPCLANLDKLLHVPEESEHPINVDLSEANWSVRQTIVGKIKSVTGHVDLNEIASLRGGYFGTMIYLMDSRPSVHELFDWPDKNSIIISSGGGDTSEEMNYARSGGTPYINNAECYFSNLVRLDGKVVRVFCSSPTRIEDRGVKVAARLLSTEVTFLEPIEYINQVATDPIVREMAYAYLAWCVEESKAGAAIYEQLKPMIQSERCKRHIDEGRQIPIKRYPEGRKIESVSQVIRALARFGATREQRNFDYAEEIAQAFPCEALVEILTSVLSETKGLVSR